MRLLTGIIVAGCIAGLLFFSLRPAPLNAGRTAGLPKPIAQWINAHDHLANFLAFAGLGLVAVIVRRPSLERRSSLQWQSYRVTTLVALGILAAALEGAQLLIPGRVSDLKDILAAWAGLILVWMTTALFVRTARH